MDWKQFSHRFGPVVSPCNGIRNRNGYRTDSEALDRGDPTRAFRNKASA
ncbi:hypothetical protein D1BOALGB6SA_9515 [Olavius sp. associated proteobacterium Delta 1]|nr:hypothetical protein D1BOALGB6SA_9515 [Olavius sp. associated proteobacterium Delta 1]